MSTHPRLNTWRAVSPSAAPNFSHIYARDAVRLGCVSPSSPQYSPFCRAPRVVSSHPTHISVFLHISKRSVLSIRIFELPFKGQKFTFYYFINFITEQKISKGRARPLSGLEPSSFAIAFTILT